MILYRSSNLPFTEKTLRKLLENKVARLFVNHKSKDKYQKYIEQNLDKILEDIEITEEKKAGILYETSQYQIPASCMESAFENTTAISPWKGNDIRVEFRLLEENTMSLENSPRNNLSTKHINIDRF